jgi:hypothetical protein
MDATQVSPTAAAVGGIVTSGLNLWLTLGLVASHIGAFFGGLFTTAKSPTTSAAIKTDAAGILKDAVALAPVAAQVATLAGQPATAAGIAATATITDKVLTALNTSNTPAQVQALVNIHAQALAASNPPEQSASSLSPLPGLTESPVTSPAQDAHLAAQTALLLAQVAAIHGNLPTPPTAVTPIPPMAIAPAPTQVMSSPSLTPPPMPA